MEIVVSILGTLLIVLIVAMFIIGNFFKDFSEKVLAKIDVMKLDFDRNVAEMKTGVSDAKDVFRTALATINSTLDKAVSRLDVLTDRESELRSEFKKEQADNRAEQYNNAKKLMDNIKETHERFAKINTVLALQQNHIADMNQFLTTLGYQAGIANPIKIDNHLL